MLRLGEGSLSTCYSRENGGIITFMSVLTLGKSLGYADDHVINIGLNRRPVVRRQLDQNYRKRT